MKNALFFLLLFAINFSNAQNYQLVWEDNFNGTSLDSSFWNIEQTEGVWNTGANGELQHYKKENVSVGDDGNGNNCLILTAKKEDYNGYSFTSGKVTTKGKLAFRRGKLEASIKIPNLKDGLWPAFWTLGYTSKGWPDCGEIDILEMGFNEGIMENTVNSTIGAHLFWGPYPRDWGVTTAVSEDLSTGYYKHTLIWDEESISVYFNDATTPYFSMGITGDDAEEFRIFQNYIILNLAVGGSVTGIFADDAISADLPANMYVDWVKLYQEEEKVDLDSSNLALYNTFGVFEDEGFTDMRMDLGYDLFEETEGLEKQALSTSFRGNNSIAYQINAAPFKLSLAAGLNRNMSNYTEGSIQFYMKTTVTEDLQIGVADNHGNEVFITLAEDSSQNIVRDNEWHFVSLSLHEFVGQIDLSTLKDLLIIKGEANTGEVAIDEVIYSESQPRTAQLFGIYTNNPTINEKFIIDNEAGFLHNWDGTVVFNEKIPAFEGKDVLSFHAPGNAGWWGFGIYSPTPLNLNHYNNGFLHLKMRTTATQTFSLAIQGADNTNGSIEFKNGTDRYGFQRDGNWHHLTIPMADLISQGLDLSNCENIFTMSGSNMGDIGVDDIYLSEDSSIVDNPSICYAANLEIFPNNATLTTNSYKRFYAKVTNQFGNPFDANVSWNADGGSIQSNGTFSAEEAGTYTIWAIQETLSDSTLVFVEGTSANDLEELAASIRFINGGNQLSIAKLDDLFSVTIYDINGRVLFSEKNCQREVIFNLHTTRSPVLFIALNKDNKTNTIKLLNRHSSF